MLRTTQLTQVEKAKKLGVSQSTISRELKSGRTNQIVSNRTYYSLNLADARERICQENRELCRAKNFRKYNSLFFEELQVAIISQLLKTREHSIDIFVNKFSKEYPDEHIFCIKTVYALIDQGVLLIRNIDLLMKTSIRPSKNRELNQEGKTPNALPKHKG